MKTATYSVQKAADRAFYDHGWLKTYHALSFADYYDPANTNWGALRVFNHDFVAAGRGFGAHPHRDMEILTYVLEGALAHQDSLGNSGVVRPGGVQYVSAGTGVKHSEMNASADEPVEFVQMWVMPRAAGLAPNYGQVDFDIADRTGKLLCVASGRAGESAPIAIHQDASCAVARLEDTPIDFTIEAERYGFLFAARGPLSATVNGESITLEPQDTLRLRGAAHVTVHGTGEIVLWNVPNFPEVR